MREQSLPCSKQNVSIVASDTVASLHTIADTFRSPTPWTRAVARQLTQRVRVPAGKNETRTIFDVGYMRRRRRQWRERTEPGFVNAWWMQKLAYRLKNRKASLRGLGGGREDSLRREKAEEYGESKAALHGLHRAGRQWPGCCVEQGPAARYAVPAALLCEHKECCWHRLLLLLQ